MPLQVIVTEGVLTQAAEQQVFAAVTHTFLKLHQLSGNPLHSPPGMALHSRVVKPSMAPPAAAADLSPAPMAIAFQDPTR